MKPTPGLFSFKLLSAAAAALILLGVLSGTVLAQQPTPSDDEVNALAREMYCPVCENVPLDVCPTQACAQWRETIREKLALGWTDDQIKDYFVNQYGDRVLAEPPRRGFNWLVYILPPLFILIGVIILAGVFFAAWKALTPSSGAAPSDQPSPGAIDGAYISRVEEELSRRKKSS